MMLPSRFRSVTEPLMSPCFCPFSFKYAFNAISASVQRRLGCRRNGRGRRREEIRDRGREMTRDPIIMVGGRYVAITRCVRLRLPAMDEQLGIVQMPAFR